jgi:effector-binding domain-containing protein
MKKNVIISLLVLVVLVIFFFPYKQQKTVHIHANYFIAFQQLQKPENWKNWQPNLYNAWKKDSSQVKITKKSKGFSFEAPGIAFNVNTAEGFAFKVDKKNGGKNSTYTYVAIPDNHDGSALILVIKRSNLFESVYNFFSKNLNKSDILYLKNYLEDARLYYGFDIKSTTVTDSNIVVIKKVVAAKNKLNEIAQIQLALKDFIQKHQLKAVQPVIADIRDATADSVRIMIGIPVDKQTVSAGKVKFMHIPEHGKMLTGTYTGKYSGRQRLYVAMKSYLTDHNLATPEDPYEKYLDNKIPVNDTSVVRLQVNFPIY